MTARYDFPRTHAAILADYHEMTSHGATHTEAARRLGISSTEMHTRLRSEKTKTGRKYVGIDLSSDYLDLSLRTRLAQTALLDGGAA